jgi:hypothetical protein
MRRRRRTRQRAPSLATSGASRSRQRSPSTCGRSCTATGVVVVGVCLRGPPRGSSRRVLAPVPSQRCDLASARHRNTHNTPHWHPNPTEHAPTPAHTHTRARVSNHPCPRSTMAQAMESDAKVIQRLNDNEASFARLTPDAVAAQLPRLQVRGAAARALACVAARSPPRPRRKVPRAQRWRRHTPGAAAAGAATAGAAGERGPGRPRCRRGQPAPQHGGPGRAQRAARRCGLRACVAWCKAAAAGVC